MLKTVKEIKNIKKEYFKIPKTVQEFIPVSKIYEDGIFVICDRYTQTFRFTDINYNTSSTEEKKIKCLKYCDVINTLDSGIQAKISLVNRKINVDDFESTIKLQMKPDGLDHLRKELNDIVVNSLNSASGITQELYLTITVQKKNIEEARGYFLRIGNDLATAFLALGSYSTPINTNDKLRLMHDFFKEGEESNYRFNFKENQDFAKDFRDILVPTSAEIHRKEIIMGERYMRTLFLNDYPNYLKDDMLQEICAINKNLVFSIDLVTIPTDEAIKEADNRLMIAENNISKFFSRQRSQRNIVVEPTYHLAKEKSMAQEFVNDITVRDQRVFIATMTLMHSASTLEELNNDTDSLKSTARKHGCSLDILDYQQAQGLQTVLPFGINKIYAERTLTTESTAIFMPFKTQEIFQKGGSWYGRNAISNNLIYGNRETLMNGNAWILATSGGGKSFITKVEAIQKILGSDDADIIFIDPEREYVKLTEKIGGQNIKVSSTSPNHINAMDMDEHYNDGLDPVKLKSEFMLSLCQLLMERDRIGANERSIIDRCVKQTYEPYKKSQYKGTPPTLRDFRNILNKQKEPEARMIALSLELFTEGSLDTFAQQTNVNMDSRVLCFDTLDLGESMQSLGMLVIFDNIYNRILKNRKLGRKTYIFFDEIHLMFAYDFSANYLKKLWKRVRKYGGFITGINQNVEELLRSDVARSMLANSEMLIMLNQAPSDRVVLSELLGISQEQLAYVTDVPAGRGLIKYGPSLVPFINEFPRDTELYKLFDTKVENMGD